VTHSSGGVGGGGSIFLEEPKHSYVLYICKYFIHILNKYSFLFNEKNLHIDK
jgi:hypothetical protein